MGPAVEYCQQAGFRLLGAVRDGARRLDRTLQAAPANEKKPVALLRQIDMSHPLLVDIQRVARELEVRVMGDAMASYQGMLDAAWKLVRAPASEQPCPIGSTTPVLGDPQAIGQLRQLLEQWPNGGEIALPAPGAAFLQARTQQILEAAGSNVVGLHALVGDTRCVFQAMRNDHMPHNLAVAVFTRMRMGGDRPSDEQLAVALGTAALMHNARYRSALALALSCDDDPGITKSIESDICLLFERIGVDWGRPGRPAFVGMPHGHRALRSPGRGCEDRWKLRSTTVPIWTVACGVLSSWPAA